MPDEIDTRNVRDISISASGSGIAAGSIQSLNVNIGGTDLQTLLPLLQNAGLFSSPVPVPSNDPIEIGQLRRDYYNLFVIEDETYKDGSFSISRSDALTRYTHNADHFRPMTADIIAEKLGMCNRKTQQDHRPWLGHQVQVRILRSGYSSEPAESECGIIRIGNFISAE